MRNDLKALIVLFKAQQNVLNSVKKTLEKTPLNLNEFMVLEALNTKGQLTTHDLVQACLIPNSSLTYVLDNLETKGLIKRKKSTHDRRVQKLELTPTGTEEFKTIYETHFIQMRTLFNILSEDEEADLIDSLKKLGKEAQRSNSDD